jgi:hypothetical protein
MRSPYYAINHIRLAHRQPVHAGKHGQYDETPPEAFSSAEPPRRRHPEAQNATKTSWFADG